MAKKKPGFLTDGEISDAKNGIDPGSINSAASAEALRKQGEDARARMKERERRAEAKKAKEEKKAEKDEDKRKDNNKPKDEKNQQDKHKNVPKDRQTKRSVSKKSAKAARKKQDVFTLYFGIGENPVEQIISRKDDDYGNSGKNNIGWVNISKKKK